MELYFLVPVDKPFVGFAINPCKSIEGNGIEACKEEEAEFWSVYIVPIDSGSECIADCETKNEAEILVKWLESLTAAHGKKSTIFEVKHGNGGWIGKDSKYHFESQEEAEKMAKEFKENPRTHNATMSDENVKYWSSQSYTITKKTTQIEELKTI